MARKKGEFDVALMSKLLALSSSTPEGQTALHQAAKHCEDCGMAFDEGCALVYGASDTDLLAQLEAVKAELDQAKQDNAELVDRYDAELAKAEAAGPPENMGVMMFLGYTWAYPQCRMVLFTIIAAIGIGNAPTIHPFPAFLLIVAGLWMFLLWCAALHGKDGYGPLIVKTLLTIFGLVVAFNVAHSAGPGGAVTVLIFMGVFMCLRLIENVMRIVGEVSWVRQVKGVLL